MSVEVAASTAAATDVRSAFDAVLQTIIENGDVVVHLASTRPNSSIPSYARLGLTKRMSTRFSKLFDKFLKDYARQWHAYDIELLPYDADRDSKDHIVEWIYLPDYEMIDKQLLPLREDSPKRISPQDMKDNHFVSRLRFYAAPTRPLYDENTSLVFYRQYNHSNVLGVSLIGAFWDGGETYDEMDDSALVFDKKVDCVQYGHYLFIFKKHNFHVMFRLEELVRPVAQKVVSRIGECVPILNFSQFEKDCQKPLSKLLKLRNIGHRPYLNTITMDDLERVIVDRELDIDIEEVDGKKHLVYDPSDQWAILSLLDDDHVTGDLTRLPYQSHSKTPVMESKDRKRKSRRHA